MTKAGGELLVSAELPPAGRCAVDAGMRQVERLTAEMLPLRRQITAIGARQPGCKALQCHYGIGALLSVPNPSTGYSAWLAIVKEPFVSHALSDYTVEADFEMDNHTP